MAARCSHRGLQPVIAHLMHEEPRKPQPREIGAVGQDRHPLGRGIEALLRDRVDPQGMGRGIGDGPVAVARVGLNIAEKSEAHRREQDTDKKNRPRHAADRDPGAHDDVKLVILAEPRHQQQHRNEERRWQGKPQVMRQQIGRHPENQPEGRIIGRDEFEEPERALQYQRQQNDAQRDSEAAHRL